MTLRAPGPLSGEHRVDQFDCGVVDLNVWLSRRALRNQISGATRTFVVCVGDRVVGYYALASGAVAMDQAASRLRRSMPDPIPVVLLARLAVDRDFQGRGLARSLMQDAAQRVLRAADVIGIRGLLAHALSDSARAFYKNLGFDESPLDPMTLMITLVDLRAIG